MTLARDSVLPINGLVDACCGLVYIGTTPAPAIACLIATSSTQTVFRAYSLSSGHAAIGSDLLFPLNDAPTSITYAGGVTTGGSGTLFTCFSSSQTKRWQVNNNSTSSTISNVSTGVLVLPASSPSKKPGYVACPSSDFYTNISSYPCLSLTSNVNEFNYSFDPAVGTCGTVSAVFPYLDSSDKFTCIRTKWQPDVDSGNPSILVGAESGQIYEIHTSSGSSSLTVAKMIRHRPKSYPLSNAYPSIVDMAFLDGLLLVSDSYGFISLYEWESGELLQREMMGNSTNGTQTVPSISFGLPALYNNTPSLSSLAYPTIIAASGQSISGQGPVITQLDMFSTPMKHGGQYLCDNNVPISSLGGGILNGSVRTWFACQPAASSASAGYLHFISESGWRPTSIQNIQIKNGATPIGGEVIVLDDPSQPSNVVFASTVPANSNGLHIPISGTTPIYVANNGKGENLQTQIARL